MIVVALVAKYSEKLSKLLSKGFERSVYWNEYKVKSEKKNPTNELRYFVESYFVRVNRLFTLVYSNEDNDSKRFKAKIHYLPKRIMKSYNVIINAKKHL